MLGVGASGAEMHGYVLRSEVSDLPKFELPPPEKLPKFTLPLAPGARLNTSDVALVVLYGVAYCAHLNSPRAAVVLYRLSKVRMGPSKDVPS